MGSGGGGGEVHFGKGATFETWRGGGVVQSRNYHAVISSNCGRTGEETAWLLSDYASIGGSLSIGEVIKVNNGEVIDRDGLAITL